LGGLTQEWLLSLGGTAADAKAADAVAPRAAGDHTADEAAPDARVMAVHRDPQSGERWRDWKSVAAALDEQTFDDWPLEGPRTLSWIAREMGKVGGGPMQHHQRWRTSAKVDDSDRSVHEHEVLCLALELGGCYDQMELGSLAAFEVLARRLRLLEESKAAGGAAAYEGAKFFLGSRRGGTLMAPTLSRHVATRLQEEVAVMKERREHMEEMTLARVPPGKAAVVK